MGIPAAIVFINNDIVPQVINTIKNQLQITITQSGNEFDSNISNNENYIKTLKMLNERVLVIRPFDDYNNRDLADIAIFFKNGSVAIEKNNFGPPTINWRVADLHWGKLCIFAPVLTGQSCKGCDNCCGHSCKKCGGCNCYCKCSCGYDPCCNYKCAFTGSRYKHKGRCPPKSKGIQPNNYNASNYKKLF